MRIVFFDLETGGTDHLVHPITQIAAVAVDEDYQTLDTLEIKLQFDTAVCDPEALKVTGYSAAAWVDAIPPASAVQGFGDFCRKYADVEMISKRTGRPYQVAQLAGHNAAGFDGPFIRKLFADHNAFLPASFLILDTLQLAMWRFHMTRRPIADFKLATLCEFYGVELSNAHDALADVIATAAVCEKLLARPKEATA